MFKPCHSGIVSNSARRITSSLLAALAVLVGASVGCSLAPTGSVGDPPPVLADGPTQMGVISEYNVVTYGAVGDGKTDDTAAFEAALQDAVKHNGGIVYVPVGVYKIGNLVFPDNRVSWVTLLLDGNLYLTQTLNMTRPGYALVGRRGGPGSVQHQQFPATTIYFDKSVNPVIRVTYGPDDLKGIGIYGAMGDAIVATGGAYELNLDEVAVANDLNGTGVPLRVESAFMSFGLNVTRSTFRAPSIVPTPSIDLKNYGFVSIDHTDLLNGGIHISGPNAPQDAMFDFDHILYENGQNALLSIDNSHGWISAIRLQFCDMGDLLSDYRNDSLVYNSGNGLTSNMTIRYSVDATGDSRLIRGTPIHGVSAYPVDADSAGYQWYLGQSGGYSFFDRDGNSNLAELTVGTGGTKLTMHLSAASALNFPTVPAQGQQELAVTLKGAEPQDACSVSPQSTVEPGLAWSCYVSATDTVEVRLLNASSVPIDPSSHLWTINLWQH